MASGAEKDWYSVLGAEPTDSLTELRQKYQKLAIMYHPDKQSADVPAGELKERVQRFIEIDQAWKILGNEERKKDYDLQQRELELTKSWPVDAQISLEDMSWDNDEDCYLFLCRCGGKYTLFENDADAISLVGCDTCSLIVEIIKSNQINIAVVLWTTGKTATKAGNSQKGDKEYVFMNITFTHISP